MKDYRYAEKTSSAPVLEKELTILTGSKYSVAVNSCSSAIFISLKACGISLGELVFVPAYTSIAAPSAIIHAGGTPVLVEITKDLVICLKDLEEKIIQHPSSKTLLLSYMRCHIPNMDELLKLLEKYEVKLIEDAAHAFGAYWGDKMLGTLGLAGCYSAHSSKIIKSGEGGLLVTSNETVAAKSICYSGAHGDLWKQHGARPSDKVFSQIQGKTPSFGLRITNSTARKILAQLPQLDSRRLVYKKRFDLLKERMSSITFISFPKIHSKASPILNTLSFYINYLPYDDLNKILIKLREIDQSVSWHGDKLQPNTRSYREWYFIDKQPGCDNTKIVLSRLFEIKINMFESEKSINEKYCLIEQSLSHFYPSTCQRVGKPIPS